MYYTMDYLIPNVIGRQAEELKTYFSPILCEWSQTNRINVSRFAVETEATLATDENDNDYYSEGTIILRFYDTEAEPDMLPYIPQNLYLTEDAILFLLLILFEIMEDLGVVLSSWPVAFPDDNSDNKDKRIFNLPGNFGFVNENCLRLYCHYQIYRLSKFNEPLQEIALSLIDVFRRLAILQPCPYDLVSQIEERLMQLGISKFSAVPLLSIAELAVMLSKNGGIIGKSPRS